MTEILVSGQSCSLNAIHSCLESPLSFLSLTIQPLQIIKKVLVPLYVALFFQKR
jgi:hypothetical protein